MNWLLAEQARRNAAGSDRWTTYASHRQQVTERLLRRASSPPGRIGILGAGNCNDLDLAALSRVYREINLVDVDAASLRRGADRQGGFDRAALRLHGGIDLTGCWSNFARWERGEKPAEAEVAAAIEQARHCVEGAFGGPFDVVVSTCVVSQLIDSAVLALGANHPRLLDLILALRTAHLRLLCRLMAPGGRGMLATDFVSSVTLPELSAEAEPDWPALLEQILPRGNFFHGLNPLVLRSLFQSDPELAQHATGAELTGFWRWNQGSRIYAVCAIEFERKDERTRAETALQA